ncbi:hypothetical protein EDC01DRAFT_636970 [Geopyxis carbonaria]|nr:hypothetical protein EDC01DRAFT_636970 [Geopyxis carbonaria]
MSDRVPDILTPTSSRTSPDMERVDDEDCAPTRSELNRLRQTASSSNKRHDPEAWWTANDALLRHDLHAAQDDYKEAKRLYTKGTIPQAAWDKIANMHLLTCAGIQNTLMKIRHEKDELEANRLQKHDSSPAASTVFVSILLECLEPRETRKPQFHRDLKEAYNAEDGDESLFCPVFGYAYPANLVAAHIFPVQLGRTVMGMIFGEPAAAEMFSPRNGLLLSIPIENEFNKHRLVIVPANGAELQENGTINDWVLRVIDRSILNKRCGGGCTFQAIDGTELSFQSDARPAASYLYLHYLLSLIRAHALGTKVELQKSDRVLPWATPGPYIRASMVRCLVAAAGETAFAPHKFDACTIDDRTCKPKSMEQAVAEVLVRRATEAESRETGSEDFYPKNGEW